MIQDGVKQRFDGGEVLGRTKVRYKKKKSRIWTSLPGKSYTHKPTSNKSLVEDLKANHILS